MTTYMYKGDDVLSVSESVMALIIEMGAIEYADNSDIDLSSFDRHSDNIKYDLKITVTKLRRKKNNE